MINISAGHIANTMGRSLHPDCTSYILSVTSMLFQIWSSVYIYYMYNYFSCRNARSGPDAIARLQWRTTFDQRKLRLDIWMVRMRKIRTRKIQNSPLAFTLCTRIDAITRLEYGRREHLCIGYKKLFSEYGFIVNGNEWVLRLGVNPAVPIRESTSPLRATAAGSCNRMGQDIWRSQVYD